MNRLLVSPATQQRLPRIAKIVAVRLNLHRTLIQHHRIIDLPTGGQPSRHFLQPFDQSWMIANHTLVHRCCVLDFASQRGRLCMPEHRENILIVDLQDFRCVFLRRFQVAIHFIGNLCQILQRPDVLRFNFENFLKPLARFVKALPLVVYLANAIHRLVVLGIHIQDFLEQRFGP